MAFGKHGLKRRLEQQTEQQHEPSHSTSTDRSEEAKEVTQTQTASGAHLKPLLSEIDIISQGKGKNPRGSKRWRCKHCNKPFASSYTRGHYPFFGAPVGKKAQIQRSTAMNNKDVLQRLRKKVEEAEQNGISASLTRSTIKNKDATFSADHNRIADGAFDWMNDTYKKGKDIVKYFLNHTHAHAIFRTQSNLDLLKVAKTRFASHHLLLKRLASCKEVLATMVVLRAWKDWLKSGDKNARAMGAKVTATIAMIHFGMKLTSYYP
ncbi:hypothetical protein Cgig2_008261 [Carnegiea gigantea]|uniref:Uncharacterized protein n=1 Tax=Carnegiea gigantea TaxID=171969 RepID=A0A9Q1L3F7_9CARY|nr:hypothetical protein Cgig2_008261 [Carnegiea gigantea]